MNPTPEHHWLLDLCGVLIAALAPAFILLACRVWQNYKELKARPRMDHRVMSFPKPSERGFIAADFMRGIAEACCLVSLLASVLGWWHYKGH